MFKVDVSLEMKQKIKIYKMFIEVLVCEIIENKAIITTFYIYVMADICFIKYNLLAFEILLEKKSSSHFIILLR